MSKIDYIHVPDYQPKDTSDARRFKGIVLGTIAAGAILLPILHSEEKTPASDKVVVCAADKLTDDATFDQALRAVQSCDSDSLLHATGLEEAADNALQLAKAEDTGF